MIVIISPAKSLDFDTKPLTEKYSTPVFLHESGLLVKKLKRKNPEELSKLMSISAPLADLNAKRFSEWKPPFDLSNSKQCVHAFTGDVFRGLGSKDFSEDELEFSQKHLRILSGLYGVLKPLDLIQPYRLEMGTRLKYAEKHKNLYEFWGRKITNEVNNALKEVDNSTLINLASNEYFKSVLPKTLRGQIITPVFKEFKNDEYKVVMTYAKTARGLMSRFIIKEKITDYNQIKGFTEGGYSYNEELSSDFEWIFTR